MSHLHIAATYTLLFNGSLMVRSGLGYALCFDHIAPSGKDSPLAFRPFTSPLPSSGKNIESSPPRQKPSWQKCGSRGEIEKCCEITIRFHSIF